MYSELSIIISLSLIFLLITTHFNLKKILFNFENTLKNKKKEFMYILNNIKLSEN